MGTPHMTTCDSILAEIQLVWDETGESYTEREEAVLQIEQCCAKIYKATLDEAKASRVLLQRAVNEAEVEMSSLASSMGEKLPIAQVILKGASLREQLARLRSHLERMRSMKKERLGKFLTILSEIHSLQYELYEDFQHRQAHYAADENNLTLGRLAQLEHHLNYLNKEKSERQHTLVEHTNVIYKICAVLDSDCVRKLNSVHPSLVEKSGGHRRSIRDTTMEQLLCTLQELQKEKETRLVKLQELGAALIELWSVMDTAIAEQECFQHVTIYIAAQEHEVTSKASLSMEIIEKTEIEVRRLERLKASKLEEFVTKKQGELKDICTDGHIMLDVSDVQLSPTLLRSGAVDLVHILSDFERRIGEAKEEVFSKKDILQKVEKWVLACKEEAWLEEYNKDENRYSVARGGYLNMKRAERARATMNKLPALVESLVSKIKAWEKERGEPLLYDGVRLLQRLEDDSKERTERHKDKQRHRGGFKVYPGVQGSPSIKAGRKVEVKKSTLKPIRMTNQEQLAFAARRPPFSIVFGHQISPLSSPAMKKASPCNPKFNGVRRSSLYDSSKDYNSVKDEEPTAEHLNQMPLQLSGLNDESSFEERRLSCMELLIEKSKPRSK